MAYRERHDFEDRVAKAGVRHAAKHRGLHDSHDLAGMRAEHREPMMRSLSRSIRFFMKPRVSPSARARRRPRARPVHRPPSRPRPGLTPSSVTVPCCATRPRIPLTRARCGFGPLAHHPSPSLHPRAAPAPDPGHLVHRTPAPIPDRTSYPSARCWCGGSVKRKTTSRSSISRRRSSHTGRCVGDRF